MAQEVICPACGTRMKAGRRACLRCGEKLIADDSAAPAQPSRYSQFVARWRGPLLAGGIVLPLVAAWVNLAVRIPADGPADASAPAVTVQTPSIKPVEDARAEAILSTDLAENRPFVDPARGGTADYAR